MGVVNAIVLQQHPMNSSRNSTDRYGCERDIGGTIDVVVVPEQYRCLAISLGGHRIDVGGLMNASVDESIQRDLASAGSGHTVAGHQGEHPEDVENRFIDSVRSQRTKAFEEV